ncbi:MAG: uncharacterized protein AEth_00854 [Candidatus Argoarchaeum ethanivorans]|uniref:DUF2073 domain-containing protein n=1 Tax=Candidatus Argoarchaeum ethanivorans TaxID=2608793 RepID=A0A8B3S2V1_9EURY|nr:MAG: uncharacterized protein AEth_00854 [Candidatus Argoarchaeum ethanivorans]
MSQNKNNSQTNIQLDFISEGKLAQMAPMEKIRMLLDEVRSGKIVVLERGLAPDEEAKLIEMTMTEIIPDEFSGIEIESYPTEQNTSFLRKILGKTTTKTRLTVIGPADQLKTIKKDRDMITAIVTK